jgi:hypothetical protein
MDPKLDYIIEVEVSRGEFVIFSAYLTRLQFVIFGPTEYVLDDAFFYGQLLHDNT